jgi:predicted Zn-dependent protease
MGVGALTLACGGMRLPSLPTTAEGWAQAAGETAGTTISGLREASECAKLRSQVSVEEEYTLGGAVALNWVAAGDGLMLGESHKPLQRYLNRVGKNLAAQSTRPSLRWTFGVLADQKTFNAASAPAGYVFVTRRLLQEVENEAQLAGVLAHEIAHVTLKHALTRYDDIKVGKCKAAIAARKGSELYTQNGGDYTPETVDIFVNAIESSGAIDLDKHDGVLDMFADELAGFISKYGFEPGDEHTADAEALRLLVSAGYDGEEYIRFLGKLPKAKGLGFSHHPSNEERQKQLRAQLAQARGDRDTFSELSATQGLKKPALPKEFAIVRSQQ